jgi:hypothetical protein
MSRRPARIDCPDAKAEGRILGHPYDTQLASSEGVWFHVWLGGTEPTLELLDRLSAKARSERDVVRMTFSDGEPAGFWAQQDIIAAPRSER